MESKVLLEKGLTEEEVNERREKGLYNGHFQARTKTIGNIFFSNIFTLFNFINIGLAVAVLLVHSYRNMLFLGVVIWNIGVGIIQEVQAKRVIDKLSVLSQPKAGVMRNGKIVTIHNADLVLDDLLILEAGNQICADSVIIIGTALVDESLITGESNPILKNPGDKILSGSFVLSGSISARVIHVGKENYVNKIIGDAKYIKKPNSEIMKSTKTIIKVVSVCLLPITIILFSKQMFSLELSLQQSIVSTVAAVIGMIPNGLVLLSTCVLAIGVVRLAKRNTLVQELYCIEALARVDVLCLDKTGTITEGVMELNEVIAVDHFEISEIEKAITAFAYRMPDKNQTIMAIREQYSSISDWELVQVTPFTSANKWSLGYFKDKGTYILGAPENVLGENYVNYEELIQKYIKEGNRVLVFAKSDNVPLQDELPEMIQLMAILIINERIRDNAPEILEYFDKQDVCVKVISGDNPVTVSNIAKRAGLKTADRYIDARTISQEDDLNDIVERYSVFGRVTPYQKLELIKAIKSGGHTVAMTGDGVNDVLALKEADCSIAMESGSDAARSSSQIVLLDSNFASLPAIVDEGRRSINNLERSATLYLVKTIYSTLLAVIFSIIALPYPFLPIQLTLVGAFAIGIPSFILALEPNFKRVKGKFLMNVARTAIPGGLLVVINVLITMLTTYLLGEDKADASTMATYSTIITSMIVLFSICKPFNTMKIILFTVLIGAFSIAALFFGKFFSITNMTLLMNIVLIILGIISFGIFNLLKKLVDFIIDKLGY